MRLGIIMDMMMNPIHTIFVRPQTLCQQLEERRM